MTPQQYATTRHETPYTFQIKNERAALYYFGTHHSASPDDPVFETIHTQLISFRPDIVFVEGMQSKRVNDEIERTVAAMSYAEAIERGGEPVYTVKLAMEHGVEWRCPEPEDEDLYAHLVSQRGFSRSHVAAWHLLQLLPQWQRRKEEVNFKDYTNRFRELFAEKTQWPDFDYSYEYAMGVAAKVIGHQVKLHDREEACELTDPIPWGKSHKLWTVLNRVCQESSVYRDEEIVRQLGEHLGEGKRVFVVYGASHAVMQEPALHHVLCG